MKTSGLPPFIQDMIAEHGEERAKHLLRSYFRSPKNIEAFALLFSDHVPSYPPELHSFLISTYIRGMREGRNVGGHAPRGFAKSTITSLVFLAWLLLTARIRFIVFVSDTFTQATNIIGDLKIELESNPAIHWLYGNVKGVTWSEDEIIVHGRGKRGQILRCKLKAVGAGMKVRGLKFMSFRPGLYLLDDLENDEAVQSKDRREKLKNWLLKAVLRSLAVNGIVIMVGTILHKESLLNKIVNGVDEFAGWISFHKPAIIEEEGVFESAWPDVWPVGTLLGMRDDPNHPKYIGPVAFNQEMQGDPLDPSQQIIGPEWIDPFKYKLGPLINNLSDEEFDNWLDKTFHRIIGAIDPAISEKETADFWAMATIGITLDCPVCEHGGAGHIVQLDMVKMREKDPGRQADVVVTQYQTWIHDKIRMEAVAYQAGLEAIIRKAAAAADLRVPVRPFRDQRDKVRRATVHSAMFAGGMVHLREDHPLYTALRDQITSFPQVDHDDMFDALMSAAEPAVRKRWPRNDRDRSEKSA